MLRSGQYQVGDRMPSEWELVERLSVGRSAIREGMRELAAIGLIDIRHGSGTFVKTLRPDLLRNEDSLPRLVEHSVKRDLLEVRFMIEPEAAALAAKRATQEDLRRLSDDVDRLREAVPLAFRPPEDLGFHLDVIRATHNQSLLRVASPIIAYYQRDESLPTKRDIDEHSAIYRTVRDKDPEGARRQMRAHLTVEMTLLQRRYTGA
jgi:GntR family transcriptional repressor for pyruvate dehydrogenase complex